MPISQFKKNVLVEEVLVQAALAMEHYASARARLADEEFRQSRLVWAHIQGFLAHTAMISKMFASPGRSATARDRSSELCAALQIDANSAVFDRNARNNVEHLDERLDDWLDSTSDKLLEIVVENREGFEFLTKQRPGSTEPFVRRLLIEDEMVFVTQGRAGLEETNLASLAEEVGRIKGRAEAYITGDTSVHRIYPGVLPVK